MAPRSEWANCKMRNSSALNWMSCSSLVVCCVVLNKKSRHFMSFWHIEAWDKTLAMSRERHWTRIDKDNIDRQEIDKTITSTAKQVLGCWRTRNRYRKGSVLQRQSVSISCLWSIFHLYQVSIDSLSSSPCQCADIANDNKINIDDATNFLCKPYVTSPVSVLI